MDDVFNDGVGRTVAGHDDGSVAVLDETERSPMMGTRLFVGNLSWTAKSDDLWKMFGGFGYVLEAVVVLDYTNRRSKGFGFVEFRSPEDAARAVRSLNGRELLGRPMRISLARPKQDG